jgi:cytochrome b561
LYARLLIFPVSGYLLSAGRNDTIDLYGVEFPQLGLRASAVTDLAVVFHDWLMSAAFYAVLMLHIGAVVKWRFLDHDKLAVRRMLR